MQTSGEQQQIFDARALQDRKDFPVALSELSGLAPGESAELLGPPQPGPLLTWIIGAFPRRFDFSPLERGARQSRYEIAARKAASPRTAGEYLAWDHDRLDAKLARALEDAKNRRWGEARALLGDFSHGLLRHIDIEERILFPAFEQRSGMFFGGPTSVMRHEHDEIKVAVGGIIRAGQVDDMNMLQRFHRDLLSVLEGHNMKEEEILYPATDRQHEEGELEELVVRMLLA